MWLNFFLAAANVVAALVPGNESSGLNWFAAGWCAAFGVAIAANNSHRF